jgi:hypothetical protein
MPVLSLPLAVLPTMGIKVNHAGNVTSSTGIALFVYVTQDSGIACAEALGEAGRVPGRMLETCTRVVGVQVGDQCRDHQVGHRVIPLHDQVQQVTHRRAFVRPCEVEAWEARPASEGRVEFGIRGQLRETGAFDVPAYEPAQETRLSATCGSATWAAFGGSRGQGTDRGKKAPVSRDYGGLRFSRGWFGRIGGCEPRRCHPVGDFPRSGRLGSGWWPGSLMARRAHQHCAGAPARRDLRAAAAHNASASSTSAAWAAGACWLMPGPRR